MPNESVVPSSRKMVESFEQAVADISDGSSIMIGGFSGPLGGIPQNLILALHQKGVSNLAIIAAGPGLGAEVTLARPCPPYLDQGILIENNQVRKAICGMALLAGRDTPFLRAYRRGEIELEECGHGNLIARIRAGGAGIPAFFTPVGVGTLVEQGKETRTFDGRKCMLEFGLKADYVLVRAHKADHLGNLVYVKTGRNLNPVMAPAGRVTIAEVDQIVDPGELDPEAVITPGIYVQRIVRITEADRRTLQGFYSSFAPRQAG